MPSDRGRKVDERNRDKMIAVSQRHISTKITKITASPRPSDGSSRYLPGYYSAGLEQVQVDGDVLFGLLKKSSNVTYKHLKKQRVDPILIMMEWFMCVFSRTLPWPSVLRVSLHVFESSSVVLRL